MRTKRIRAVPLLGVLAVLTLSIAGCASQPAPVPVPSASSGPVITPSELPEAPPEFLPDGSAEENREYFDYVVSRHVADGGAMSRDGIVAALTAAGWGADAIEATPDATPLGNAADALTFAVRAGDDCLIGQWHGEYSSIVAPLLASGRCLVGAPLTAG